MEIRFRHLRISDGIDSATGFALCYNTIEEAETLFDILRLGYEKVAGRKIELRLQRMSNNFYDLIMKVKGGKYDYNIELHEIERQYVLSLKEAVQKYGYIFIITAKSKTIDEFTINKGKYCCINEFYIDSDRISNLNKTKRYPSYLIEQYVNS